MRILYISDSSIPSTSANSVHVMKMGQALAKCGHNVELWAKNTRATLTNVNDPYKFYAVEKNFTIKRFPSRAFSGSGVFYNFSLLWRLVSVKYDLLYTRSITAAFLLVLYGKRVCFEIHEPYEGKGLRLRWMFRYLILRRYLCKLIVISSALRNYYVQEYGLNPESILVAHDSADPFPIVDAVTLAGENTVGYVGSLLKGKGAEILMPLAASCPDISFHVVGGSDSQIHQLKSDYPNATNVTFHGFRPQNEIARYIQSFDILIAPYLRDVRVNNNLRANNLALWMSPLKLFEYMSSGKPIVASALPVIQEILSDRDTALLCDPDRLDDWRIAIFDLLKDKSMRSRIADNARNKFIHEHTWLKRAELILAAVNPDNERKKILESDQVKE